MQGGEILFTKTFQPVQPGASSQTSRQSIGSKVTNTPLNFVPNMGQIDAQTLYYSRGSNYGVHFNKSEVFFAFISSARKHMHLGPAALKNQLSSENPSGVGITLNNADASIRPSAFTALYGCQPECHC